MNPDQFPDPELCLHQTEQENKALRSENKALRQQIEDTVAQRDALAALLVESVGPDALQMFLKKTGL